MTKAFAAQPRAVIQVSIREAETRTQATESLTAKTKDSRKVLELPLCVSGQERNKGMERSASRLLVQVPEPRFFEVHSRLQTIPGPFPLGAVVRE